MKATVVQSQVRLQQNLAWFLKPNPNSACAFLCMCRFRLFWRWSVRVEIQHKDVRATSEGRPGQNTALNCSWHQMKQLWIYKTKNILFGLSDSHCLTFLLQMQKFQLKTQEYLKFESWHVCSHTIWWFVCGWMPVRGIWANFFKH